MGKILFNRYAKLSYSQCGEDLIVKFIFDDLKVVNPSYMDVGALSPYLFSNTAIFYDRGSKGINIEPDPSLFKKFARYRNKDVNLNIGVASEEGELDFYIISQPTMNTFSRDAAERLERDHGFEIAAIKKIKVDTVQNIVNNYCGGVFPDYLSLDVEGMDAEILRSIDYENSSPIVICVETISYSTNGNGIKDYQLVEFLKSKGYMVFADTYINTILVKKDIWVRC
jgi:FkbM family methyltransferase